MHAGEKIHLSDSFPANKHISLRTPGRFSPPFAETNHFMATMEKKKDIRARIFVNIHNVITMKFLNPGTLGVILLKETLIYK